MAQFKQKYQQWLSELEEALARAGQQQVLNILAFTETLTAYVNAGKALSAYETQLFIETLKRQLQQTEDANELPAMWSEELWQQLSKITDKTQVEWSELMDDFKHQGVYYQGEYVGMGRYRCSSCQESIDYTHPAELLCCADCRGIQFFRDGLPV